MNIFHQTASSSHHIDPYADFDARSNRSNSNMSGAKPGSFSSTHHGSVRGRIDRRGREGGGMKGGR